MTAGEVLEQAVAGDDRAWPAAKKPSTRASGRRATASMAGNVLCADSTEKFAGGLDNTVAAVATA